MTKVPKGLLNGLLDGHSTIKPVTILKQQIAASLVNIFLWCCFFTHCKRTIHHTY
jgi:hypothetical protein